MNEAPPPPSVPWSAIQNSSLYGSDGHGNNVTMFPVSSIHLKVFMTNVYSSLSLHSSPLSNWWFPSRFVFKLYSFISYSPLPTTYFSAFPSIPTTHTHTYTQTTPPCQSVNVTPVHPVTRVMTTATNYTPSTIPMALISWLAAMQCDSTTVPLLLCVFEFDWKPVHRVLSVCAGVFMFICISDNSPMFFFL